jgi:coenzyme F420-reducing hydrogenase delta subunit
MQPETVPDHSVAVAGDAPVTAFLCAHSAHPGLTPSSGIRPRPAAPNFQWPFVVQEILVPCTGRLQPEHLLKAFEDGARVVCVVACEEDNCHHLEGSCRARLRVDYVRRLLDEIGLGGERLMLFHLPGSAREDMALGLAAAPPAPLPSDLADRLQAIRDAVVERAASVPQNPLRKPSPAAGAAAAAYETDDTDDSEE